MVVRPPDSRQTAETMTSAGNKDAYVSEYPTDCKLDADIKALIAHYYEQVDTQGKHAEYSECWAEDGVLIVPTGKAFRGRDGLSLLMSDAGIC